VSNKNFCEFQIGSKETYELIGHSINLRTFSESVRKTQKMKKNIKLCFLFTRTVWFKQYFLESKLNNKEKRFFHTCWPKGTVKVKDPFSSIDIIFF
jgi:hypothetical protein